jgi:hypothetical protein
MSYQPGEVLIGKLAAAQRQLDAAIRLTFLGEDPLAIYTVTAAALGILLPLAEQRGKNPLAEQWKNVVVGFARDLVAGKLTKAAKERLRREAPALFDMVEAVAQSIKDKTDKGESVETADLLYVTADPRYESIHWSRARKSANFLKHADRDPNDLVRITDFDTESMLIQAIQAYMDVMRYPTYTMNVYFANHFVEQGENPAELNGPPKLIGTHFVRLEPSARRPECLRLIGDWNASQKKHTPDARATTKGLRIVPPV